MNKKTKTKTKTKIKIKDQAQLSVAATEWLYSLNKIQTDTLDATMTVASTLTEQTLLYILTLTEDGAVTRFSVELVLAAVLKKGGYGADTPFISLKPCHKALLSEEDLVITHNLQMMEKNASITRRSLNGNNHLMIGMMAQDILMRILKTNRCHWKTKSGPKLTLGETLKGHFEWDFIGPGRQKIACKIKDKSEQVFIEVLPTQPLYYITSDTLGCVVTDFDIETTQHLMNMPSLGNAEAALLCDKVRVLPRPKLVNQEHKQGTPIPYLKLTPNNDYDENDDYYYEGDGFLKEDEETALAILHFQYDNSIVNVDSKQKTIDYYSSNDTMMRITRDKVKEAEYLSVIQKMQVAELCRKKGVFLIGVSFVFDYLPILQEQNWIIDIEPDFPFNCVAEDEWYTEVEDKSQYDWFGFELGILVNGEKINILPLLVNLISKHKDVFNAEQIQLLPDDHQFHLQLPDTRYIAVEAKRIKDILFVLVELYDDNKLTNGKIKVDYFQAGQLLNLQQALNARWLGGEKLKKLGEKLLNFKGIQPCLISKKFRGQLRPYQHEGLNWLNFLREFQLGGILADDMGLGKTIQVLTYLLFEKEAGRQTHPNLIVAPTSLLSNWSNEAKRFTPDLKILILQGKNRQADFECLHEVDIVLSTYPLIVRDKDILINQQFHYLILDEAQYIKNSRTKCYQELLNIKAQHTLCMTGTPMENHLGELWSLFNFTMPGLLGDERKFKQLFRDPIEREGNVSRQKSLAQRVRPFMLRRTKEEVATELPEKTEIIHRIELKGKQLDLYESIRLSMQEKVQKAISNKGLAKSQIIILDALLKLRQTCNDPSLLPLLTAKNLKESAKRVFLLDMLDTLIAQGRKILLFSSFASMLNILEKDLIDRKINYTKLTGQTTDRVTPIHRFQEGDAVIMLISLKAGGVGLNLTAADTVIHYDPWWNPAVEAQATDRAHRIGQTKPVFVYKLVCKGTIEERILTMQENKRQLSQGLFSSGKQSKNTKLSAKDLEHLFEPLL